MSDTLAREIANLKQRLAELETRPRIGSQRGTFTPTFAGTGTAGTFTYATQNGEYRRLGDQVWVWIDVAISAISVAPTGTMRIAGLPFATGGAIIPPFYGYSSSLVYPAGALEMSFQLVTGTAIDIIYTRDNLGVVAYPAASFTNTGTRVRLAGTYLV